jgi:hypothetical protein
MAPINFWQSWKEILLLVLTGRNFDVLGMVLNCLCDVFLPNGLPKFLRRRLSSPPPQLFGEAMLCLVCRKIFEVHKHEPYFLYSWTSYRHQDDLSLLERSAGSGCDICARLYEWVKSIENGPDWCDSLGVRFPWGFTIRSHLSKSVVDNHFELDFTIPRYDINSSDWNNHWHTLSLIIVPATGKSIFTLPSHCPPSPLGNTDICL